jgi:aryl-alcohol dehydrogenase-like predicted oxidoreductase
VLTSARDMRVPWLDTADIYGDGEVETLIGEVFHGAPEPRIVTKLGYEQERGRAQCFAPGTFARRLAGSLARLRRDRVDVLLLHSPPPEVLADRAVRAALADLRSTRLTGAIGVSLASVHHYPVLGDWRDLDSIELIYNLLDQRAAEFGYLEDARQRGRQIIARMPLCSGFLARRGLRREDFAAEDTRRRWSDAQITAWTAAAERFGFLADDARSMAQAAIAFCCASPGVSLVIPGAKSPAQLAACLAAGEDACAMSAEDHQRARALWPAIADVVPA